MKKFKSLFKILNQSGATLVEVMIAASLAAVVSLAVMRIGDNSSKALTKMEADAVLRFALDSLVRRHLSSETACMNTLGPAIVTDTNAAQNLNSLIDDVGNAYMTEGQYFTVAGDVNRYWRPTVGGIRYVGFVADETSGQVGTCKLQVNFENTLSKNNKSFGTHERSINFDLTCKRDPTTAGNPLQSCILNNATNEGMWTKIFAENLLYINYNDLPNGFVGIGNFDTLTDGPEAPLEIIFGGSDTKIDWYQAGYSFGMQIPKDSVYSWRQGNWGISESGTDNTDSCLSLLAYDNQDIAVYPFVRLCGDKNYFRGGLTILGSLGQNAEPGSLEIFNGSLVCTGTNYANSTGAIGGTDIQNVYICGNSNSTTGENSFVSGISNDVDAGEYSLVLGTGNKISDDAVANSYYDATYDDINFSIGIFNNSSASHNFTFGGYNTNHFTNSKVIGSYNRVFETTYGTSGSNATYVFGYNNQTRGDNFYTYFNIGARNFLDNIGMVYGLDNVGAHNNAMIIGERGYSEVVDELVISNNATTAWHGQFRFAVSNDVDETYYNALTFTPSTTDLEKKTAGAFNHGNVASNFKDLSLSLGRSYAAGQWTTDSGGMRRDVYSAAAIASSHSDVYATRSAVAACYNCLIRDRSNAITHGNAIVAGLENEITSGRNSVILAAYQSKISEADYTNDHHSNGIYGGGLNEIQNGGFSLIIGGSGNKMLCGSGQSCNSSVIVAGSSNEIRSSTSGTVGVHNGTILGGYKNILTGNSTASTSGYNHMNFIAGGLENQIAGDSNAIVGGMRNNIDLGNMNFICGGFNNKITTTAAATPPYNNTILGGRDNVIQDGAFFNVLFGTYTTINAGKYGNMVLTDYDSIGSSPVIVNTNNNFYGRFRKGYYLFTNDENSIGVKYGEFDTGWASVSSRAKKENFENINYRDFLMRISAFNIKKWNYISAPIDDWHIGPMAQDFFAAFEVGNNDKTIEEYDINAISLTSARAIAENLQQNKNKFNEANKEKTFIDSLMDKINELVAKIENMLLGQEKQLTKLEKLVGRVKHNYGKKEQ